jgi:RiboL-PSP-HEPN
MRAALSEFNRNIEVVRELDRTVGLLKRARAPSTAIDDLIRFQIVMAVSALDLLIHQIVRDGMIETAKGARSATPRFYKYRARLELALMGLTTPGLFDWLSIDITEQHSRKSFQTSERVAEVVHLVSLINLWQSVSAKIAMAEPDVKKLLDLIVSRRNQIVHEFDSNPLAPGTRWPVDRRLTRTNVTFIAKVGRAIVSVVK